MLRIHTILLFCLSSLLSWTPAAAHNTAVALAMPVSDIIVDGDFSDWPQDLTSQAIEMVEYGEAPTDPQDLSAAFRVGYDRAEQRLYVAVEVSDQSSVIDSTSNVFWNTNDGCELYLDVGHGAGDLPQQHYVYGTRTSVSLRQEDAAIDMRWQHEAGVHRYEWSVDLGGAVDRSVGFDVVVTDKDDDGSFSWMTWGDGVAKVVDVDGLGDVVVLQSAETGVGLLQGQVTREDTSRTVAGRRVQLQSASHTALTVVTSTDAGGRFALDLPAGMYSVSFAGARVGQAIDAQVSPSTTTDLQLAVLLARGVTVRRGRGELAEVGEGYREHIWQSLGVADGLPGNWVRDIVQGPGGYLWIGTEAGLSRFDGRYLLNLDQQQGLPGNEIRSIVTDSHERLWVGTDRGLSRIDAKEITNFSTADGLPSDQIRDLAADSSGLWIATDAGLAFFDGWEFTNYSVRDGLPGSQVRSVLVDQQGGIWMGIWGRGLCRFDATGFQTFASAQGLNNTQVRPVVEDRRGRIWFGTEAGVSLYSAGTFTHFTAADGLVPGEVWSLYEDRSGKIWIGTFGGGLSVYDGHSFVNYSVRDGLASDIVLGFGEDRDGVLWVGTDDGVSRHDERFTRFSRRDGLAGSGVSAILQDRRGDLWIGSGSRRAGGLSRLSGKSLSTYVAQDGLADSEVWSLTQDRAGTLWIGTARGVSQYQDGKLSDFRLPSGAQQYPVSFLVSGADETMWLGSWGGGLSRWDGQSFQRFTTDEGLGHDQLYSGLLDERGHLWLATWGGGVSHFDGTEFTNYTTADGLASDSVWVALAVEDGMWFGTHNGLSYFDGRTFVTYQVGDGLASNRVHAIMRDDTGHLWLGTDAGVSRFDGQIFQTLLRRDGLISNSVRELFQDREGAIWIGTSAGLTKYERSHTPPPAVITDVITDEGRLGPVSALEVTTAQDLITLEFSGISFKTRPEAMAYRHRLVGYDDEWRSVYSGHVELKDLPRGDYIFEVVAVDRDLSYSEAPAQVQIHVGLPGFRIAMWTALSVSLGLILWQAGLIIRRNRSLRSARDGLELRVEERTRELRETQGQLIMQEKMASLGMLVAGVAHEINSPMGAVSSATDTSRRCIERITEMMHSETSLEELVANPRFQKALSALTKNTEISLLGTERIERIVSSLRNFARLDEAELQDADLHEGLDSTLSLLHHELKHTIELQREYGDLPSLRCFPQELNQVFMNLLTNAIHALEGKAGTIHIRTWADENNVYVAIHDSGRGISRENLRRIFDPGFTTKGVGVGTGLGLSISYKIIEKHRGEIRAESVEAEGTCFTVSLPRNLQELLDAGVDEA